ncbi:hypothetical protein [Embleya scabrispora]|uniref:hypothetical protein n=1 Tax=Embleya scabrispora TaxID=159449 RepID=UPI002AA2ABBD|nr:hypothetical protein [Embleya scabrispora]
MFTSISSFMDACPGRACRSGSVRSGVRSCSGLVRVLSGDDDGVHSRLQHVAEDRAECLCAACPRRRAAVRSSSASLRPTSAGVAESGEGGWSIRSLPPRLSVTAEMVGASRPDRVVHSDPSRMDRLRAMHDNAREPATRRARGVDGMPGGGSARRGARGGRQRPGPTSGSGSRRYRACGWWPRGPPPPASATSSRPTADHRHPERGSFAQRLSLRHRSTERPMVLYTGGYDPGIAAAGRGQSRVGVGPICRS